MKKRGTPPKFKNELIEQAVKEYLESDLTIIEVATKYGMSAGNLHYHIKKKEMMTNGVK